VAGGLKGAFFKKLDWVVEPFSGAITIPYLPLLEFSLMRVFGTSLECGLLPEKSNDKISRIV
jgi:hypothetical protein